MQAFSIAEVGAAALLPPPNITVSEWADANRRLTGSAAAERGQWRTRPYQREPMDCLGPQHPCRQVVIMSSAQMLKTECLLNFLGYIADVDPGPVLVVEPRMEDAKALSKDRVAPMFRATPQLAGKLAAVKSRDSDNTVLHKAFPNDTGHVTFTGAISPSGLAMRPIRYALLDEVDRYPVSAGSEGDPVYLAIQRTTEFKHNKKILLCSTPTIAGASRIFQAWLESDQREWMVPCPHCGHYQILAMGNGEGAGLVWPEGEPHLAQYRCEGCSQLIPHHEKERMEWQGKYVAHNPGSRIPGFHVSQLHSMKRDWGQIATEFIAAKKAPETLRAFVNTVLGELWEERSEVRPDAHALWNRCEPFESECPSEVCIISAGVDVQADRLVVEVVGWGRDEESWSLDHVVIPGDVARDEVWRELDAMLLRRYAHPAGDLPVHVTCVDSGYKDAMVLRFTRDKFGRRVYAIKGRSGDLSIWPRKPSRKNQTPFFIVGVDAAKDAIYDRLKIADVGPLCCHFPIGRDLQYFDELTSEKKMTVYHNGYPKRQWKKPDGARNEALDCRVYAYAGLHALYFSGLKLNSLADKMAEAVKRAREGAREAAIVQPQQHRPAYWGDRKWSGF